MLDPAALPPELPRCDLVIDAAYGTGFRGEYAGARRAGRHARAGVDVPSGLDADTGRARRGRRPRHARPSRWRHSSRACSWATARSSPAEIEVAPIGIAVPPGRLWLVEDARHRELASGPRP